MKSLSESSKEVAQALSSSLQVKLAPQPAARVHGGSINESYRWESVDGPLFVKIAESRKLAMFEAEADGLNELKKANAVRVPRVLAFGTAVDCAYLALEWIGFGSGSSSSEALLGEQLARQHRATADKFGWHRDNTIGSTAQPNAWSDNWVVFFRERRLRHQLDLARDNGYGGQLQEHGTRLLERMEEFFAGHTPCPSLLHGDLWGGNWSADAAGAPVIFDPAVYYGDREADIAMTRLFGGFGARFYDAYHSAWPLDAGARTRTELYNLYHLLNHLNLFGGGYLAQAESAIERLLAEAGR